MSDATVPPAPKPYAIHQRLARRLALQVAVVLALMVAIIAAAAHLLMQHKQESEQAQKARVITTIAREAAQQGGLQQVPLTLSAVAPRRPQTRLTVRDAQDRIVYEDPDTEPFRMPAKRGSTRHDRFVMDLRAQGADVLQAELTADVSQDRTLMEGLVITLLLVPLAGGMLVAWSTGWRVRKELHPLHQLAQQTSLISPQDLTARLRMNAPVMELLPWVEQFNALMQRLQTAVEQLESFNADVAHELRTPLAALMGHAEVALSRERSAAELRETLAQSLEDLQRVSAMVEDMLFLSRADRGALARRGEPCSMGHLAAQVVDLYELALEDRGLSAFIDGDATLPVDQALVQRALSNLLTNALRYAQTGSRIRVYIQQSAASLVWLGVENHGPQIDPEHLPRLFGRFFRGDSARVDTSAHHGLGLAIVAAVARMHGGTAQAHSAQGITRVELSFAVEPTR
ncbi:MAG: heavy metal sensor histidine kinase [Burkholderiales bacterium]|nr:heavy metal sensor histidine kinase [Burkholderiales bacterium]